RLGENGDMGYCPGFRRREFLGAALASVLRAAPAQTDEAYWRLVKRQFPLEAGLIYLNAANVCPASRPVMDRHWEFLRDFHANPSFQNRDKYGPLWERARAKLAELVRVTPDEIAILRNTSEGNNVVIRGIDLKPGDEVLITDHNHPSNNHAWKVRARREGFLIKSLPVPVPPRSQDELLAAFEKAITPRTRVIAVTHVTNTTGILYPARQIAELARKRDIWMHLDGAQTLGALDFSLREIGCDSYAASAHKWPMGPLEAGLLYVRADRIPRLWPAVVSAGWSDTLKGARKFETLGQRDDARVVAFEAAVDFLNLIGMKNVEARVRALATHLKRGFAQIPGLTLKTNHEPELSGGVIKVALRNGRTRAAYDALWQRRRIAIAMTASGDSEGLRLCPHVYNSPEELEQVIAAVREVAG
ncbi:MAG: aminotransferase class V-fold PLP-dependent enzyme, partial [Acidobacteriota bacterium]